MKNSSFDAFTSPTRRLFVGQKRNGIYPCRQCSRPTSPMDLRNKLVNTGHVSAHHFLPQPGWVIYWIKGEKMLALRPSNEPSHALRYI